MKAKMLMVGETPDACAAIRRCLTGLNVEICLASTGDQALECVCEEHYAFLIVAHTLDDMKGVELAELIHGDMTHQHLPIVLVATEEQWEAVMYRAHEVGVVDFFTKPFRRGLVRTKVSMFLRLDEAIRRGREQSRQLEQSNRDFRDFAHAAAHDLKAPLRAVNGYLSLVEQTPDSPERDSFAESIRSATKRMGTLIEDMLQYAKVDGSTVPHKAVELNSCIESVLEDLRLLTEEARAEIEVGELPTISGNASQLRRLFQNIVGNALKYKRSDTLPKVSVRCVVKGSSVEIRVEDNGTGFEMTRHDDIFKPFCRLVPSDGTGSGVGLATAKRIVERHGGSISATSVVDEGSTFIVTLPLTAKEISDYRRRLERCPDDSPRGASEKSSELSPRIPKLLVVDDCHLDQELTCLALQGRFEVVRADGSEQALDSLDGQFDAVLSDYNMPRRDGIWLLSRIAERRPGVRRLLMTNAPDGACEEALQSGLAQRVLEKPVDQTDILAALEIA